MSGRNDSKRKTLIEHKKLTRYRSWRNHTGALAAWQSTLFAWHSSRATCHIPSYWQR